MAGESQCGLGRSFSLPESMFGSDCDMINSVSSSIPLDYSQASELTDFSLSSTVISQSKLNTSSKYCASPVSSSVKMIPLAMVQGSVASSTQQNVVKAKINNTSNPNMQQIGQNSEPSNSKISTTHRSPSLDSSTSSTAQGTGVIQLDSNTPKQFVPCRVCGDKASGYHYGVTSCEGCKGFFRRSIQKQIEYRCLREGKCLVMRLNRNRCQYCRFKKCLAVGMSRESVRYGRVPKRSRSQDEQKVTTTVDSQDMSNPESSQESLQLAMYDIILTVSQAHHANCSTTDDKLKQLVRQPTSLFTKMESSGDIITADLLDVQRCLMFQKFAPLITPSIHQVVEFAKRVPGFGELTQDNQLVLIKMAFFEIWLARSAKLLNPEQNSSFVFSDGTYVYRNELEILFEPELVMAMYDFAVKFVQLGLNDTEIGLFAAVILTVPDRSGLTGVEKIEKMQESFVDATKLQLSRNHSFNPQVFSSMLMKISELRAVGLMFATNMTWFRLRWSKMHLPPLFSEIFDIPKAHDP